MNRVLFFIISLLLIISNFEISLAAEPNTMPTFECLGLYWSPSDGSVVNECKVEYRFDGTLNWKKGQSLWFDTKNMEYRGSIVGLMPQTTYNVRLTLLGTGTTKIFNATTWSEKFPVGTIDYLPKESNSTLTINQSGTADSYRLYRPELNNSATIDVNNNFDQCITVSAGVHHVIIRNLMLKDGKKYGILLGTGAHDIVIERCKITNWGDGSNYQGGISTAVRPSGVYNIIIQRNTIHTPRVGTNDWSTGHPRGPQGIFIHSATGGIVIRYNTIYSEWGKYFNDPIGGLPNRSATTGFVGSNSDIYGNHVQHGWDDGIECEGINENVRIWGNYISNNYVALGIAGNSRGPLYVWRNIFDQSRASTDPDSDDYTCYPCYGRGEAIKSGYNNQSYNKGPRFIYHNTTLQHSPPAGKELPLGSAVGGISDGGGGGIYNTITRNNIFQAFKKSWNAMDDGGGTGNDFDYDLYWPNDCGSTTCAAKGYESNGINSRPIWESGHGDNAGDMGIYWLGSGQNGHDDGVVLPNFNDGYEGNAPDMGAHERGSNKMEFGINAYLDNESSSSLPPNPPINLRMIN